MCQEAYYSNLLLDMLESPLFQTNHCVMNWQDGGRKKRIPARAVAGTRTHRGKQGMEKEVLTG